MNKSKLLFFMAGAVLAALLVWWLLAGLRPAAETPSGDAQTPLGVILTRTSVRAYRDCPVGADTVELLLRAAMAAPTAVNRQPWAFVVVDDPELLRKFSEALPYAKMAAGAPVAVVVCGDLARNPGASGDWWVMDAAAASENLLLAAHAVGLGAVWTGVYPRSERVKAVREILGLPGNVVPLNLIPIGYPAETPAPKQKWNPANVRYNGWAE
ncbi:nitroreductase family protein [uncultured Alistipes sp.]|uniref:nitroreductase family protein n=1 Tax=uncultured Alistipes sp. TaxID=538949 RepID=UPI0026267D20|nr:nitroreductase family protein [uncultured Alistipes sp.]